MRPWAGRPQLKREPLGSSDWLKGIDAMEWLAIRDTSESQLAPRSAKLDWRGSAAILTSVPFVGALGLLAVNDTVLKSTVGGWWTGKASDFAGLFVFPLLLSALLARWRPSIFYLTALGFLFWKSPWSGPPLDAWNSLDLWPLARVVDYTDWIALAAVLPAYLSARHHFDASRPPPLYRRQWSAVVIAVLTALAVSATSRPAPMYSFPPQQGHLVAAPRAKVRATLDAFGWLMWSSDRPRPGAVTDTVSGLLDRSSRWISVTIELRDAPTCGTLIIPLHIQTLQKNPDLAPIQQRLFEHLIEPLHDLFSAC